MSKWGWAARIGGYAAAPFTGGASIALGEAGAQAIEAKQRANKKKKAGTTPIGDALSPEGQLQTAATEKRQQAGELRQMGTEEALAPVTQFYKQQLGEDPSALMDATKGERGRVIDQYDAARRAASQFGPRGGGTNAAISESYFQQANQLSDITSMAKKDAASQLGQLGATMTGLGLSADQLASADLATVIQAVLGREQLKLAKRGQNLQLAGDIGSAAGSIAGAYMTR